MSKQISTAARRRSRRALMVAIAMIGTAVALWLGAASYLAYGIVHPPFASSADGDLIVASEKAQAAHARIGADPQAVPGAAYDDIHVDFGAGKSVGAWLVAAQESAAIVLVPPSGASRRVMLPYLPWLHSAGWTVLLIDSADGQGRSSWGLNDRDVVASAAAMLHRNGYPRVAALGVSEGAAAAILARARGAGLAAIVADSSYANLQAMYRDNPTLGGLNPAFLATIMGEVGLALGEAPRDVSPADAAGKLRDCSLMVIQNRGDPVTPQSDGEAIFARANTARREIWIAPSNGHGDAIYEAPDEYRARVLAFLAKNLAPAAPH